MKRLSNLLAALVFASLVIFISCGKDSGTDTPDPQAEKANQLAAGTWSISATASNVTFDNGLPDGDWDNFTLSFSGNQDGGSYTAAGAPSSFEDVWTNGTFTWDWVGSGVNQIMRQDGTTIDVDVSDSQLILEFRVTSAGGRASGIAGDWTFTFTL